MADGEGGGPFFVVKGVERGSMFLKPLVNKLNLRKNANKLLHLILRPLDPPPPAPKSHGQYSMSPRPPQCSDISNYLKAPRTPLYDSNELLDIFKTIRNF